MFNRQPYTMQELTDYGKYIETMDRLVEKAKRNYLGSPEGTEKQKAKAIYDGYVNTLIVAQHTYQRILTKVAK